MKKLQFLVALLLVFTSASASAQESVFRESVQPFFTKYCNQCHGKDLSEGQLRLDTLKADFKTRPAADHWVEILDRINLGEMPPTDKLQPSPHELRIITDWVAKQIQSVRHESESTGGQVLLRRMTRLEYANTIRDLLKVEFIEGEGPIDLLPPDGSIRGFDRNSNALLVDPSLMQAYLDVASRIADQAVRFRPPLVPERTVRFEYRDIVDSAMSYQIKSRDKYLDGDTLVIMHDSARSFAKLRHPFNDKEVPITGRYRVRVQASAEPGEDGKPVYMRVKQGPDQNIAQFRVDASPNKPKIYEFETIRDEMLQGEYGVGIVDGKEFGTFRSGRGQLARAADDLLKQGKAREATIAKTRLRAQGDHRTGGYRADTLNLDRFPKLRLDWIEVTGPLQGAYPPASMTAIFPDGWEEAKLDLKYAEKIFSRLLPRAYRRRILDSEVEEVVNLVKEELNHGNSFESAIKTGIVAMLCSPKFLYLYEPNSRSGEPRKLNEFELATRLSYLLWGSKPDDDLFRVAAENKLSKSEILNQQVDRLLADPRSEGFVQGFVRQWLKIDEFDRFPPDQSIFPDYYATDLVGLDNDLLQQPLAMVRELIAADDSLLSLLESDWTVVNERLARFYNIPGVKGNDFQRIAFQTREQWETGLVKRMKGRPSQSPWFEVGPFFGGSFEESFADEFGPERDDDVRGPFDVDGQKLSWAPRDYEDSQTHTPWTDNDAAFYLARWIVVAEEQEVELRFGSDDAIKAWFNGKEILSDDSTHGIEPSQFKAAVTVKAGRNLLLVKIVNGSSEGGFWFESDLSSNKEKSLKLSNMAWALSHEEDQRSPLERQLLEQAYERTSPSAIRGGLLGMAGVHRWGSDGSRTKPVERGKYILDVLFNDPPPPPPPNAGEVEPNVRGEKLTVAQRLAKHREQVTCNNCHRRIDPYGLALENFNVIGQWRTRIDGEKPLTRWGSNRPAIQIGGTLPSGDTYDSFIEFKQQLSKQDDRFLRGVTEKLLMFAMARTIEPADRNLIDTAVENAKRNNNTMRSLIKTIVNSQTFQRK